MFYVYVLKSLKTGRHYTGFTGKTPQERLQEHNRTNMSRFDKAQAPFVLIYTEEQPNRAVAMKREKELKSGQGREWLHTHLRTL